MNFFKPEDFARTVFNATGKIDSDITIIDIAQVANAKLEREGKVVYCSSLHLEEITSYKKPLDGGGMGCVSNYRNSNYKALLINIEPLQKENKRQKAIELIKKWLDEPGNYDEEIITKLQNL
jgi:hypothetical protein